MYSVEEEKARAKAWMNGLARRTIAHSSSQSVSKLARNNSDGTSVLHYVEDVTQFKPNKPVKKLIGSDGALAENKRKKVAAASSSSAGKPRFTGYADLDEDLEFAEDQERERLDDEKEDSSRGYVQAQLLEMPSADNVQDSVVLTLLKACSPSVSSIADQAVGQGDGSVHKAHMGSAGKGRDVYAHGLVRYSDYRDSVRKIRASAPSNVLVSSETGITMPVQFRDLGAYYPSERAILENDGEEDLAYVEHKADELLQRATVHIVDDDIPDFNLAPTAHMSAPPSFWESLFDDQAIDVQETISEGDRELIRDRDGELIDVSKIKDRAYATRNEDGSIRRAANWTKSRKFANQRVELPDQYVEDDDNEHKSEHCPEEIDEEWGSGQMYVIGHDRVWCSWIALMRFVDDMKRRDYSDRAVDNCIQLLSFVGVLQLLLDMGDRRKAEVLSALRSVGSSVSHVELRTLSEMVVSAHSTERGSCREASSRQVCTACVECEGAIVGYFVKTAILMIGPFSRFVERVVDGGAIETALARIERRESQEGLECAWARFLKTVVVDGGESRKIVAAHMQLCKSIAERVGSAEYDRMSARVSAKARKLLASGRPSSIVDMYNKAHANYARDGGICEICENAPELLWLSSVCLSSMAIS